MRQLIEQTRINDLREDFVDVTPRIAGLVGYKTSLPDLAPIFFPIMAIIINPDIVKFWPTRSKFITPSHFSIPLVCKSAQKGSLVSQFFVHKLLPIFV